MDEAILALQIAVRDAERVVSGLWDEVQKLETERTQIDEYLGAAYERYENAAEWLEGIERGLQALETIQLHANVQAIN